MTISSVLTQIFRPAVHQLKMDTRVAQDAQRVIKCIGALLNRVDNSGFNISHGNATAANARDALALLKEASTFTASDIADMRSHARDIRSDMHMQLKDARKLCGGVESWNRDRARELAVCGKAADQLVHLKPAKA